MLLNKGYVRFGIKCMFERLSEHTNNSTDYLETARSPSLPKLTPLEKCESLLTVFSGDKGVFNGQNQKDYSHDRGID